MNIKFINNGKFQEKNPRARDEFDNIDFIQNDAKSVDFQIDAQPINIYDNNNEIEVTQDDFFWMQHKKICYQRVNFKILLEEV